ncbi:hypothetical protein SAMN06265360_12021 [Haloechinothrix alba]|uniref:DUF732 domain-containing protein n=1 Tax=Haloechinothrix alba TaxID=664784 RepID=A0A238Z9P2_9PSEU|nr:hypothetical protein [Haloechinothrix alba]SNR80037.1 hypothetical protein SAMN06265360_12021 [Haloechinothrix alba]
MRKSGLLPVLVLAAAVSACGSDSAQDQWADELAEAGIEVNEGLTFEDMFERAEVYCDFEDKDTVAQLAEQMLSDEQESSLTAPGQDPAEAAEVYADATWEHICGSGE